MEGSLPIAEMLARAVDDDVAERRSLREALEGLDRRIADMEAEVGALRTALARRLESAQPVPEPQRKGQGQSQSRPLEGLSEVVARMEAAIEAILAGLTQRPGVDVDQLVRQISAVQGQGQGQGHEGWAEAASRVETAVEAIRADIAQRPDPAQQLSEVVTRVETAVEAIRADIAQRPDPAQQLAEVASGIEESLAKLSARVEERLAKAPPRLQKGAAPRTKAEAAQLAIATELEVVSNELGRRVDQLGRMVVRDLGGLKQVLEQHQATLLVAVRTAVAQALGLSEPISEPPPPSGPDKIPAEDSLTSHPSFLPPPAPPPASPSKGASSKMRAVPPSPSAPPSTPGDERDGDPAPQGDGERSGA